MGPRDYTVKKIDGEYAVLTDDATGEELFISLFLLPEETDVGTKLHYCSANKTLPSILALNRKSPRQGSLERYPRSV